jgi:branched-chain amino acid transport system permease protein
MSTITDNAVPATGRSTSDEMIAVIMTALLAIVPLTGIYPIL